MTFLENFEQICRVRGDTPCHALESAGLNKSLYTKWRQNPDNKLTWTTIQKLSAYLNLPIHLLIPNERYMSETALAIMDAINNLEERDQKKTLSYILFTYGKELPDEMQRLWKKYT